MNVELKRVVEQALGEVAAPETPRKAPDALAVDDTQLARMEEAFDAPVDGPTAPPN